ncbi:MAG: PAS domain S-box protein [Nitrospirae bacterium]|nr:PAS domain S-box protein [Nitrospirota bacterium]
MIAFLTAATVLGVGAFYIFSNLSKSLIVLEHEMEDHKLIQDLRGSIREFVRAGSGWALTGSSPYKKLYKDSLAKVNKGFKDLDRFKEETQTIKALDEDFRQLKALSEKIIAVEKPVGDVATLRTLQVVEMLESTLFLKLDEMYEASLASTEKVITRGKKIRQNMTIYLTILVAFSLLATGLLIVLMQRMLEEPYREMLYATEKVSSGDLSYRISSLRKDEYGTIARRFDTMVESLEDSDSKLKARLRETRLLLDVARTAGMAPETKEAMGIITETIAKGMKKTLCAIYILHPKENAFHLKSSNMKAPALDISLPIGSSIAKKVLRTLSPVIIDDVLQLPDATDVVCGVCRSFLVIPLVRENICIGLLLLGAQNPKGFRKDEVDTGLILAHTIDVALRNAELYEETIKKVRQLSILYELSRALTSVYRLEELLGTVTSELSRLIGAKGCIIRLIEEDLLKVRSFSGPIEKLVEDMTLPIGKGIAGWVAKEGKSILVEDVYEMPEDLRVPKIDAKTAICVPLKVGERVIGTLGLYDKLDPDGKPIPFSSDDLSIVESFASMSSTAIENARMQELDKKRQFEVLDAKKRLDLIFEGVQAGMVTLDENFNIIAANKYIERWIDMPISEAQRKSALEVFHQKGGICPHCAAIGTFETGDTNVITQSSGLNYAELTSSPIKDETGKVQEAVVFVQDITDRVLYQEEIMGLYKEVTQTKDYIESLIENSADAIVISDINGIITSWNPAAENIYGFSDAEVMGRFLPFVPESIVESEKGNIEKIKKGEVLNLETIRLRKDGRLIEVSLTLSPIKDIGGGVIGISGISRDISERKRIEKELIRRNQELSRLFFISSAMRGTLELDRLLRMVLTAVTMSDGLGFNRAILFLLDEVTGKLRGEMGVGPATVGEAWSTWERLSVEKRTLAELMSDIDVGPLRKDSFMDRLSVGLEISLAEDTILVKSAKEKIPYNVTDVKADPKADTILIQQLGTFAYAVVPLVSRDKVIGVLWVDNLFNRRPISDEDMKFLTGFSNQVASAIEGARLFQQVSRTEAELENIFRSISDMVYFVDKDYTLRRINEAVSKRVQRQQEEIIGKKCYEVFHGLNEPWSQCPHHKTVETLLPHIEEIEDPYLKGTFLTSTSPIFDTERKFIGTVHIVRDITELKELRERLASTERMAALGEVAAKVAHEIRNPLVSVGGFAKRLEGKLDGNLQEYASIISKEVSRLEGILQEILGFVRETRISRRIVNINGLLEEIIGLMGPEFSEKGNSLIKEFSEQEIMTLTDADRMKEALMNILTNANYATDGGTITVRTYKDSGKAVIEVLDTGCGIKEEDIGKIFDPFFTTRPTGTGLGLAIARRIVEEHGGKITVQSKWGGGSKFSINLLLKEV